jgi:GMP synthase-like glutamine amidotransferase
MRILCLKHISFEGPGMIAVWAQQNGHTLDILLADTQAQLPAIDSFDLLLIMGGPMSIHQQQLYPWLLREKNYIRDAIHQRKRVLGICLGAQLIASVLGAQIQTAPQPEIGWFPIQSVVDCPAHFKLPASLPVLHWHSEQFELPTGAQRIAVSQACPNQAFLFGKHVLGLQCHLEITKQGLELLIAACGHELLLSRYVQDAAELRNVPAEQFEHMHRVLFELLNQFTSTILVDTSA